MIRTAALTLVVLLAGQVEAGPWRAKIDGPISPTGQEIQIDLPSDHHIKNKGGSDGAGLCVFASLNHSAYWHNLAGLQDLFQWMRKYPGGGYPEKVDRMIRKKCEEAHVPVPEFINRETSDLALLERACANGHMPGVTYAFSPTGRYGGQRIAHMVSLVHARGNEWAILDNNYPGTIEWMSREQFKRAFTGGRDKGWCVIFLSPGPPPIPSN